MLFGKDFDTSSGPNNALSVNLSDGTNPFFLNSPGMPGFIDCDFEEYYLDDFADEAPAATQYLTDRIASKNTIVKVTPKQILGENNEYKLYLLGETSDTIASNLPTYVEILAKNYTLSERTVFDVTDSTGSFEERIQSRGSYETLNGETSATLNLKIIEAGTGSKAKFIWWYSDEAEPLPANSNYKKRVSRCTSRWRSKHRGVLTKFSNADYVLNETFSIKCYVPIELDKSYLITFQTSTDSVYEYPDQVSTSPIGLGANVIPGLNGETAVAPLEILSISPGDGSVNNRLDLNKITITFSENLDPASVSQSSIKILAHPISGSFDYNEDPMLREYEIHKIVSVTDNKIIVEI